MTGSAAVLVGARVTLRRPEARDAADRLRLGRTPEIVRMFGGDPAMVRPMTEAAAQRWFSQLAGNPHAWAIEHEGRMLGDIGLDALNEQDRRASLAIGLYDPAKLGIGLGREAILLALGHAFGRLKLHRVALRVIAYNVRAIRCYLACGFVEEGRERETAFVAGQWHDDIMMGVLAREFASRFGRPEPPA